METVATIIALGIAFIALTRFFKRPFAAPPPLSADAPYSPIPHPTTAYSLPNCPPYPINYPYYPPGYPNYAPYPNGPYPQSPIPPQSPNFLVRFIVLFTVLGFIYFTATDFKENRAGSSAPQQQTDTLKTSEKPTSRF